MFSVQAVFPDSDDAGDSDGRCPGTNGATREQAAVVRRVAFATDVVAQSVIGTIGTMANVAAATVLATSRRRLRSPFNFTLACLLLVHSAYIADTLALEAYKAKRRHVTAVFGLIFARLLHPLKPGLQHAATFITMVMARERYLAIRSPIA